MIQPLQWLALGLGLSLSAGIAAMAMAQGAGADGGAVLVLAVLAGGALAASGLGLVILLRTYLPLTQLSLRLRALADGDTATPIPHTDCGGVVGTLAGALAGFRDRVIERDAAVDALSLSQHRLRAAMEDACRADAAKSRFLAAASHDLRQPMQALRLFLDTLDRRLDNTLDRRVLAGAQAALAAGEELLRNLLDVSVLESGIVQPIPTDLTAARLMEELANECATAAAAKGLDLRVVPSSAVIRSDAALLKRMLRNLVVNAIRYTADGRILIGCRHDGPYLRIEVWDTGIGIAVDQLQAIFEDFYQIGNAERDRTKGLGLGLSVVRRTARLLGHPVTVRSCPGRGSLFAVTVPLATAPGRCANGTLAAA